MLVVGTSDSTVVQLQCTRATFPGAFRFDRSSGYVVVGTWLRDVIDPNSPPRAKAIVTVRGDAALVDLQLFVSGAWHDTGTRAVVAGRAATWPQGVACAN